MNVMDVTKGLAYINFCFGNNCFVFKVETWLLPTAYHFSLL